MLQNYKIITYSILIVFSFNHIVAENAIVPDIEKNIDTVKKEVKESLDENPSLTENQVVDAEGMNNVDKESVIEPNQNPKTLVEENFFSEVPYESVNQINVQILDKITGDVKVFPVTVGGNTLAFKRLRVYVANGFKTSPTEKLEYIAFIEIWEIKLNGSIEKIHSGWLFSGHTVNLLEHPIYDVRIVNE